MVDQAAWKNFQKQMTGKRGNKRPNAKILEEESMTVQRLSVGVAGKAKKYQQVGAREFVPFEYNELTIENIKSACLHNFDVSESAVCKVLAGELGPSCSSVKQIPNLSIIHMRFIEGKSKVAKGDNNNVKVIRIPKKK